MTEKFRMDVPIGRYDELTGHRSIEGQRVGPFLIHETISWPGEYSVTHIGTGYLLQDCIYTEVKAVVLANELIALGYDWDFVRKEDMKLTPEQVDIIRTIRHGAAHFGGDDDDED